MIVSHSADILGFFFHLIKLSTFLTFQVLMDKRLRRCHLDDCSVFKAPYMPRCGKIVNGSISLVGSPAIFSHTLRTQ